MWCNFIFIAVVFIVAIVGFSGYSLAKNNPDKNVSRSELANQLAKLPDYYGEPPEGAMCYSMAPPPENTPPYIPLIPVIYGCPACGDTTFYNPPEGDEVYDASVFKESLKRITKIDVKLDESQFCKKCSPEITSPEYGLIVKYGKDAKPHTTYNITADDITLLYEFSEGKKEHKTYFGKFPMEKYKARLEELLGTTLKDVGN
jgi:hypothetical protein